MTLDMWCRAYGIVARAAAHMPDRACQVCAQSHANGRGQGWRRRGGSTCAVGAHKRDARVAVDAQLQMLRGKRVHTVSIMLLLGRTDFMIPPDSCTALSQHAAYCSFERLAQQGRAVPLTHMCEGRGSEVCRTLYR